MGLYRSRLIKWPVIYKGVDPDSISFVPLQWEGPLTLREILKQHPKGKEYAFVQEHEKIHPLLIDSSGAVLSYPPIINSADLGAVQVGDSEIFVEVTGTDQMAVTLAASIAACDMADNGFKIEPVEMDYLFSTPLGQKYTSPFYFQEPVFCSMARVEKFLGEKLSADECQTALAKMGVAAEKTEGTEKGSGAFGGEGLRAFPPEYRNDYLHAADLVEDIMMGRGLSSFKPERPRDFTVGRLTQLTRFSRRVKELVAGLGYQEMIYNYLGARKDFVDKMRSEGEKIIRISNPMTENYEYVRDSVLPSLLISESVSAHALYPHKIFEIGRITIRDEGENYGSATRQHLGFLQAEKDANFNTIAAQVQTLFYYLSREYEVEESADARFIPGRAANVLYKGEPIGIFGELHPELLENWGIEMPCLAAEIDIEALL
jgi:phenylalanyl-tRNA synthetase beta chain